MADVVLETEALTKRFGGLVAVDAVSLAFCAGDVHCIIGPNGAGKTTFLNLLSGVLPPTSGRIRFHGQDIAGWPPYRVAQAGLGRSFQRTNIFPEFTVLENCWLGAQARLKSSLRFLQPAHRLSDVAARARHALDLVGLIDRAEAPGASLSHGEQRQLEIGVMLATEPSLLLLDEPMAGMGPNESQRMVDLLLRLKEGRTLVLIEHDMDAVFALADVITVMVNGRVLASGAPEAIRSNRAVQEAYLGEAEHA
jgi:branched-chain amino acid transport system ATP-binding protein